VRKEEERGKAGVIPCGNDMSLKSLGVRGTEKEGYFMRIILACNTYVKLRILNQSLNKDCKSRRLGKPSSMQNFMFFSNIDSG